MIELSHLSKIYPAKDVKHSDITALKNIDLSVATGEIVGVIGKSGAGKSTLIRCVNLLERPTTGSVFVNDMDLMQLNSAELRQARHQIGMIFQHFNLLSSLTVYDNVAFPLRLLKRPVREINRMVTSLSDKVGLSERLYAYPHELSGGQKQRVAIARALATKPTVLLCDEMTSSLDPQTTDDILKLIRAINQEMRISILCITHEMNVIKAIADRVAVIDHGEIIECNTVVEIFKNPQTTMTQRLIHSVLKSDLPHELEQQLHFEPMTNDQIVLRLTFCGHATLEPIIHDLMKQMRIKVSILQANIEQLRHELIGLMIVSLQLEKITFEIVQRYLQKKGITVEVMGYVDRENWFTS